MDFWNVVATELVNIFTPEGGWSVNLVVRTVLSSSILLFYIIFLARSFGSRRWPGCAHHSECHTCACSPASAAAHREGLLLLPWELPLDHPSISG